VEERRLKQWNRGSAFEIMLEALSAFKEAEKANPVGAHISLSSVHWTLAGRMTIATPWHMYQAVKNVRAALQRAKEFKNFSANQIDVLSTIMFKTPWWLGGDAHVAEFAIQYALSFFEMKPHTRALMYCNLGDHYDSIGSQKQAVHAYAEARKLQTAIEFEDSDDREFQLIRVRSKVGFFHYKIGMRHIGAFLIYKAHASALRISEDQRQKIEDECRRRQIMHVLGR
jgi:tetratricopeptide (TPR) repeat protein